MPRPSFEVAEILRQHGPTYLESHGAEMSVEQHRILRDLKACRTAALGGHIDGCNKCKALKVFYNSCRNRHCPKCQALARAKWLESRLDELLPIEYFHLVFTMAKQIVPIALQNKRVVYNILFHATAQTLRTIALDPKHLGAEIGFLAVLHTWGQNLMAHPHLHCIVPGGGFDPKGQRWVACRPGFFLPVRVLSRLFRRLFLKALGKAFKKGQLEFHGDLADLRCPKRFQQWLKPARDTEWVVYSKRPFGGPEKVLDYLGRYTHRVAISNHRLLDVSEAKVTFKWRNYRSRGNRERTMTLDAHEFIRRFLLHTLPLGFVRIRQYGFLANRQRTAKLQQARELLQVEAPEREGEAIVEDWKELCKRLTEKDPTLCPACGEGQLVCLKIFEPEAPSAGPVDGINTS